MPKNYLKIPSVRDKKRSMIIHSNEGELPLIIDELFLSHAILRKNQQEKKKPADLHQ
jgi:hypothetical protein